jgi:hypothetical protein
MVESNPLRDLGLHFSGHPGIVSQVNTVPVSVKIIVGVKSHRPLSLILTGQTLRVVSHIGFRSKLMVCFRSNNGASQRLTCMRP